jgi:hypothetical protein
VTAPLSDADLARLRALLGPRGPEQTVLYEPETRALVIEEYARALLARLDRAERALEPPTAPEAPASGTR